MIGENSADGFVPVAEHAAVNLFEVHESIAGSRRRSPKWPEEHSQQSSPGGLSLKRQELARMAERNPIRLNEEEPALM